jgi:hypothetical protein
VGDRIAGHGGLELSGQGCGAAAKFVSRLEGDAAPDVALTKLGATELTK